MIDDIIEKAGIKSLDDLTRIGVTSAEDLAKLGVNSVDDLVKLGIQWTDDLAKLGINSIDDVSKLGISKEDLSRAGIKEVRGANIKGDIYSTEDWYNYLKEKYGKSKVHLCTDEQALRNSISEKYNGKELVAYSKYYEHTLTEDHIKNSLSDEYFTSKGFAKDDVISEMKKLTDAIGNTKEQAKLEGNISRLTGNASFEKWNVENCAEVWSTRKAILNGPKFYDISFKCVQTRIGNYAPPCANCEITFENLNNIGNGK
ncbi:hypothetical protein AAGC94_05900 [Clostridium sporogenes]|uniref:hypothetical protein n=1 Tax=Clostridium TaxID=1485 RepID=UPI000695CE8E|nr:hypothetical protein [Clostridium sporogenes]STC84905.1 Uncharacterised protein [Clostridium botulinum]KYN76309.1 hypothetical protein A0J52_15085 [Clostridium sporogenes]MCW6086245.1 hypothetical protein [Clostridium sporogenes]MDS1005643.1 hypothetical protein [Clostridium sporogenes]UBI13305.1 hypothetical protein LA336_07120 [Clostridium sporogenes]